MTDTYTILGEMTLGECIPLGVSAVAAAEVSLGVSLPELEAKVAGALEAQASIVANPPTIAAQLSAAQALVVSLQALVAFPSVAINASAIAAVIAELQATLGSLEAQASIVAGLSLTLGTPGVLVVHYTGSDDGVIPGGLPGVSTPVEGVIILGADGGAIQAIRAALRVS